MELFSLILQILEDIQTTLEAHFLIYFETKGTIWKMKANLEKYRNPVRSKIWCTDYELPQKKYRTHAR